MALRGALIAVMSGLWAAVVTLAHPVAAEPRIALVIANQAYTQPGAKLTNTHRDGDLVKAALEKVGFTVWVERDTANSGALEAAIGAHVERLAKAGPDAVGFLYYSGHGAADRPDGANYLIPTQVPLTHVAQLPLMGVRLDKITATLAGAAKMSFVVFDACRNVALQRDAKDFGFKGFAPIREQRGLLVAYATEAGNVAVDQSVYAKALAEEIVKPGLEAGQVFRSVTRRVEAATDAKQSPEFLDKRRFDFQFAAAAPVVSLLAPTPPPVPFPARPAVVAGPQPGETFRDCPTCPEMVVVPAGSFRMGSDDGPSDEKPVRTVTIRQPFAVGKYEVTFAEWDLCVAGKGCNQNPETNWGRGQQPVMRVSWNDAKEYVAWLSKTTGQPYRLLSEAEWEYAARAGTTTKYAFGDTITTKQAQFSEGSWGSAKQTIEVGSFSPNGFGLHDMHGNLWEWVEDCWIDSYKGAPSDASARTTACSDDGRRVLRGGSWDFHPEILRSAYRSRNSSGLRVDSLGFRVARSVSR